MASGDDVLGLLVAYANEVAGTEPVLLVGHSAGGYDARGSRPGAPTASPGWR